MRHDQYKAKTIFLGLMILIAGCGDKQTPAAVNTENSKLSETDAASSDSSASAPTTIPPKISAAQKIESLKNSIALVDLLNFPEPQEIPRLVDLKNAPRRTSSPAVIEALEKIEGRLFEIRNLGDGSSILISDSSTQKIINLAKEGVYQKAAESIQEISSPEIRKALFFIFPQNVATPLHLRQLLALQMHPIFSQKTRSEH